MVINMEGRFKSGSHNKNGAGPSGFTLIELLVTLSIFAAIMGLLLSSFFQFQQQGNRLEEITSLRQEARVLERIIRMDVQSAIYLDEFMANPQDRIDQRKSGILGVNGTNAEMDADQIHLHVNNPSRFQRSIELEVDPEIHEVSYFLEEDDQQKLQLRRREEFYIDSDITEGDRSITHTLSYNVTSFNVQYFKGVEEEPEDEWDSSTYETSKDDLDKLPTGILISMELRNSAGEEVSSSTQINIKPYMGSGNSWR